MSDLDAERETPEQRLSTFDEYFAAERETPEQRLSTFDEYFAAERETPEQRLPTFDEYFAAIIHINNYRFNPISDTYSKEADTTFFKKSYEYELKGEVHSVELELSRDKYNSYSDYPKLNNYYKLQSHIYKIYVNRGNDDELIKQIIEKINDNPEVKNERDELEAVVSFVQTIPYETRADTDGPKYTMKYPYETVYENEGVCSDFSILLIKLLKELDYDVAGFFPNDDNDNHIGVGVRRPRSYGSYGTDYCFIETTVPVGIRGDGRPGLYHPTEIIEFGGNRTAYAGTVVRNKKEREDLSSKNKIERKLQEMTISLDNKLHSLREYTRNVFDAVSDYAGVLKK